METNHSHAYLFFVVALSLDFSMDVSTLSLFPCFVHGMLGCRLFAVVGVILSRMFTVLSFRFECRWWNLVKLS